MSKDGRFLVGFACLAAIVGALIAFVVPEHNVQRIAIGANIALVAGLFLVTAFYAMKTSNIARETRQQAEATIASVDEMRKQRYLASQPWVLPKLVTDEGQFADPAPLLFMNVGNGPAIDLKPFISDGDVTKIQDEWRHRTGPSDSRRTGPCWAALKAGTSMPWARAFEDPRSGSAGVIAVEYRDIYGREFLSGWAYRIEKVENERLALTPGIPLFPVERT